LKDYVMASGFPLLKIDDIPIPRLILGHLPFMGESYQGASKNLEYVTRFSDVRNTVRILMIAVEKYGVTVTASGMVSNDNPLAVLFQKAVKEAAAMTGVEIATIPCVQVPLTIMGRPVDVYRRWLTYYEIERQRMKEELVGRYFEDPVLQCRPDWKVKFGAALRSSKSYTTPEIKTLQVDYERVDDAISRLKDSNILLVELGSETDFIAMTGRIDLLEALTGYLRERLGRRVILGVHHAGSTIPILEESEIEFKGYVTPINRLGVMMFPTSETALEAIKRSRRPIIAIKPLAGGRIGPKDALTYVYKELGIGFCMIGMGSEAEAEEDLSIAREILGR